MAARPLVIATGAYLAASLGLALWLLPTGREEPPSFAAPRHDHEWPVDPAHADTVRTLALRQARVWKATDVAAADLSANPPDPTGLLSEPIVRCRYLSEPARGTTQKFNCVMPDGEVVKVKYGHTGEIQAELAATRLLTALGFGADRMYLIPRLRCYGCLRTPFYAAWALDYLHLRDRVMHTVPLDAYTDFDWVAVERHFDGAAIETSDRKGWEWIELDNIDPSAGATRAERDALRLAAMLLAHWDNKASNQRLVCLSDPAGSDRRCPRPFALIQDLGATFGPNKVDLDNWKQAPIWIDRARCTVSMRPFPYDGATFHDREISEAGRHLMVRQLAALGDRQLVTLFTAARFAEFSGHGAGGDVNAWARVLRAKIQDIVDGPACPSSS